MKLTVKITICINLVCAVGSLAQTIQATFVLNNGALFAGVDAPVFDSQGTPLEGTNYLAELYGGLSPTNLVPARDSEVTSQRDIVTFRTRGYFNDADVGIPNTFSRGRAWLQVRAWDARLGSTYEAVAARGSGGYGESPLFYLQGGGETGNIAVPPSYLIGLQSFRLRGMSAVFMSGIHRQGDQVVIEWFPGFPRYQLQQTSDLAARWENVGVPTAETVATNQISGASHFFRVVGLLY